MVEKIKTLLSPSQLITGIISGALVVGFLFGAGLITTSSAQQRGGPFVPRQEFNSQKQREREDKQILFSKIDNLTEKLSEIAQAVARLEGRQN